MTPKPKGTTSTSPPANPAPGSVDDQKERRSVRQNASNATDGANKTPPTKPLVKKVTNSIVIGLDKDSTTITDFTASAAGPTPTTPAAKPKRVTTTSNVSSNVGQTTHGVNASSLGNACNVVVEANKNFAQKRIKTRSAKTTSGNFFVLIATSGNLSELRLVNKLFCFYDITGKS
jgi:hypothetical protein